MRHSWILILLLVVGITAGCKEDEPAGGAKSALSQDQMPPPSPRGPIPTSKTPAEPTVIAPTKNVDATLQELTQALRDHVLRTRTVPKNFEEFASKSQVKFPPAPEGQKYAISDQAVVLVKR